MQRYHPLLILALLAYATASIAQKDKSAESAVKATINRFFEGMEKGDTAMLRSTCAKGIILQSYGKDKSGKLQLQTENFDDFVHFIGLPTKNTFKEVIKFKAVHTEQSLASAWTPYTFYLNGKVSHSGTNSFQLIKIGEEWKIQYIIDTRRK
jgi:Putative lumazine-binding